MQAAAQVDLPPFFGSHSKSIKACPEPVEGLVLSSTKDGAAEVRAAALWHGVNIVKMVKHL